VLYCSVTADYCALTKLHNARGYRVDCGCHVIRVHPPCSHSPATRRLPAGPTQASRVSLDQQRSWSTDVHVNVILVAVAVLIAVFTAVIAFVVVVVIVVVVR